MSNVSKVPPKSTPKAPFPPKVVPPPTPSKTKTNVKVPPVSLKDSMQRRLQK